MQNNVRHATRFLLRRYWYMAVVVFVAAFLALPYSALGYLPMRQPSLGDATTFPAETLQDLTQAVSQDGFFSGLNAEQKAVVYAGLGFLCALVLFRHLFSRKQSMLVAALPDKRATDFGRRLLCYGLYGLLPTALALGAYVPVAAANGLLPYMNWAQAGGRMLSILLMNVYGFAVGTLACALTGAYWTAVLTGALLTAGVEATLYLWQGLAYRYLKTMLDSNAWLKTYSPAVTLYKGLVKPESFCWLPGVLAIAAFLGLSLWLYRMRRTEAAGRPLAFEPLHAVLGVLIALAGGTLTGTVFLYTFPDSEMALALGMVMGAAVCWWMSQLAFRLRLRGTQKRWYLGAACAVALLAGLVVLHFDLIGFDRYLPNRSQLTALTYELGEGSSSHTIVTLRSDKPLDAAFHWAELMRDEADAMPKGLQAEGHWLTSSMVTVTYELEGGKTLKRCYPNDTMRTAAQPYLKAMLESDDYLLSVMESWHLSSDADIESVLLDSYLWDYGVSDLDYVNRFGTLRRMSSDLSKDRKGYVWLEALRADLACRKMEDMQVSPILTLTLNGRDANTQQYFYRSINIYPSDTHLLSAIAGSQAQALSDYLSGGYAENEAALVIRQVYDKTFAEMDAAGEDYRTAIPTESQVAATAQQAAQWVRAAVSINESSEYYMPNLRAACNSMVYVYRREKVELQTQTGEIVLDDVSALPQNNQLYPDERYWVLP